MALTRTGNTQFTGQTWLKQGADVASAATVDLGAIIGQSANLTGSVTVTSFGTGGQQGVEYTILTVAGTTFTNSGTLVCPGAVDLTTEAGDIIKVWKFGAVWYVSNPLNDDDVVNTVSAKTVTFVDGDLTAGVFTFAHNLAVAGAVVQVIDNSNNKVNPDEINIVDTNTVDIDLGSFGTLVGTYRVTVFGTNAV